MEKERWQPLAESLERWHEGTVKHRLDGEQLLGAKPREMVLRGKRWQRLVQEEETKRNAKLERSKL